MCSAVRCRSCVPQAQAHHTHVPIHTSSYTKTHAHTHTHTQRHPHRGIHDHVQTHYLLPCSPTYPQRLPQEQGGCGQGGGSSQGLPYPSGHSPTIPSSIKIWSGFQGPHQPTSSKKPSYHMPNPPLPHSIHHHTTSQAS